MPSTKSKSRSKSTNKSDAEVEKTKKDNKNAEAKSLPAVLVEAPTNTASAARRLLDKLPSIGATTRAALRSLATDAQRSDLGRQTKARGVLSDGLAMAIAIDRQIATFPHLTDTYALPRFAYFLESLLALDALIESSSERDAKMGAARGSAMNAYDHADRARTKLLKRLDRFAGSRGAEIDEIKLIPAKGRTNDEMGRSINKAVALAKSWLGRADAESVEQARLAALDVAVVANATAAAGALGGAHVDAALEGRKSSHDAPIVNLEEGNVLLEMAYAMDVFEEAHEDNDVVSRLIPGPATRHVLAPTARSAAKPAAEAPAAGGGPGNGAMPPTS